MNIKALIALVVFGFVLLFGYNHYQSNKKAEQIASMQAESERIKAETAQLEAKKQAMERQKNHSYTQPVQQNMTKSNVQASQTIAMTASTPAEVELKEINYELEDKRKIDVIKQRWNDSRRLANSTSRIALAPIIKDMQAEKRELESLTVTHCLTPAKEKLLEAMDLNEKSFVAFLNDAEFGEMVARAVIEDIEKHIKEYDAIASTCK